MRIERLNKCCGSRGNLSAVDFQPHSQPTKTQRIATSGGTYVQIWSLSKQDDKGSPDPLKCVLLFTFKEHSPYDVTTIRWSPNGQFLASTDSGGITNVLKRNEKKTKVMESMIRSKLSGEPPEIPESYTETSQIKKYTIKYDGTDQNKKNNTGVQRISLTSKNVQVESKEIKSDNLNLLNYDNLEGNLESWETLTSLSCPNNMGQLFDISWAPDNRSIIGGGMNGHVIVFDIYTKEIVAKFDALENSQDSSSGRGYIKSVSWDPMTLFVAVQSSNKEISIWRRSPPLPPGSPMKWTFKRVMYTEHFSEKSNTDVLGGSRLSWAPNGKNVVFPNSCFNNHNFSTCYQIRHNTSSFSHLFTKNNYDKNQAQYHFDTIEHPIDLEPVLLKGHNSRIRNVRFSNDIMKSTQNDQLTPNNEKYLLLAQSSDDNMLSVWRFKVNQDCIMGVECICVLKNLLDEQSSIEDLSWGDFGRCLAVASSQGGLILIEFNYEEMGTRFYTNRIQGLNLNEMNQPTYDFFEYSEYVNSLSEDPNDISKQNTELNNTNGIKFKTTIDISQNNNMKENKNNVYNNNKTQENNTTDDKIKQEKDNNENNCTINYYYGCNKEFMKEFLIFCYRIYIISVFWKIKNDWNLFTNKKRQLSIGNMYNITVYNTFYLFNFTIENESKINQPRKKYKANKKPKTTSVMTDFVTDIWLDMDYGSENTIVTKYWNDSLELGLENNMKENEDHDINYLVGISNDKYVHTNEGTFVNKSNGKSVNSYVDKSNSKSVGTSVDSLLLNVTNKDVPIDTTPSKVNKPTRVSRVQKSDKSKINKLGTTTNMFEFCNVNGLNELNENMFTYPVLKQSISVTKDSKKYLGVNFLNNTSTRTFTNSLASIDESEFKVNWICYLNKGYITHMDTWSDYLVVITQKLEGYSRSYLTVMNINDGHIYVNEVESGLSTVSMFNLLLWNNPYFVLVTTNLLFGLYKYEHPKTVTQMFKLDLSYVPRDNIIKMEVVNSTMNYKSIFDKKLRENKEIELDKLKENNEENTNRNKDSEVNKIKNKEENDRRGIHDNETNHDNYNHNDTNGTSFENLVLVLYKKNNSLTIYSKEYKELELNLEVLSYSNKSLYCEKDDSFNIDTLFRFYNNDYNSCNMYMFSQVEFDGSLSKIIESFTQDFQQRNINEKDKSNQQVNLNDQSCLNQVKGLNEQGCLSEQAKLRENIDLNQQVDLNDQGYFNDQRILNQQCQHVYVNSNVDKLRMLKSLKMKLQALLLLGSIWEYMLHLYEYVKILFEIPDLKELLDFTIGMYKTILRMINESENNQTQAKYDEIKVYNVGNYYKLIHHCLLLMRSVVVPNLNLLYRKFQEDLGMSLESFEEFELLENKSRKFVCFDNRFLSKFVPTLEYQEDEKKELLEKLLDLFTNVRMWEGTLQF